MGGFAAKICFKKKKIARDTPERGPTAEVEKTLLKWKKHLLHWNRCFFQCSHWKKHRIGKHRCATLKLEKTPLTLEITPCPKDKVAILHSSGGSVLSWNSPTGNLISRAMTKDTRQARSDELIRLYRQDNIYNFYVKGFDGNWQAQNFDTGAAVSVLLRSFAKPVQQLPGGSRQALSAKVDPKLQGRLQPRPVRRAVAVSRIPTWML